MGSLSDQLFWPAEHRRLLRSWTTRGAQSQHLEHLEHFRRACALQRPDTETFEAEKPIVHTIWLAVVYLGVWQASELSADDFVLQYSPPSNDDLKETGLYLASRATWKIIESWPPDFWHVLVSQNISFPAVPSKNFVEQLAAVSGLITFDDFASQFADWLSAHLTTIKGSKKEIEAHARGQRLVKAADLHHFLEYLRERHCQARRALRPETPPRRRTRRNRQDPPEVEAQVEAEAEAPPSPIPSPPSVEQPRIRLLSPSLSVNDTVHLTESVVSDPNTPLSAQQRQEHDISLGSIALNDHDTTTGLGTGLWGLDDEQQPLSQESDRDSNAGACYEPDPERTPQGRLVQMTSRHRGSKRPFAASQKDIEDREQVLKDFFERRRQRHKSFEATRARLEQLRWKARPELTITESAEAERDALAKKKDAIVLKICTKRARISSLDDPDDSDADEYATLKARISDKVENLEQEVLRLKDIMDQYDEEIEAFRQEEQAMTVAEENHEKELEEWNAFIQRMQGTRDRYAWPPP